VLFLAGCPGSNGQPCYRNNTCDPGLDCVWWRDGFGDAGYIGDEHKICAVHETLVIGGYNDCPARICPECPPIGACAIEAVTAPDAGVLRPCGWHEAGCVKVINPKKTWR